MTHYNIVNCLNLNGVVATGGRVDFDELWDGKGFEERRFLLYFKFSSSNKTKMNVTAYSTDSQVPQIEKQRHFLSHLHT